jgi:hypothetical protein
MIIKKGNLNYDQSGRAYPDNPRIKNNWDCIWENKGKHYKLVGDDEHKEWEELDIYNQIIDEVYNEYVKSFENQSLVEQHSFDTDPMTKEMFIEKIKFLGEFSQKWELKIEERELSLDERHNIALPIWKEKYGELAEMMVKTNVDNTPYKIPTKQTTLTYQNETIQFYE